MPNEKLFVKGKINRIYPRSDGCCVRLENPEYIPENGYFFLSLGHANYNAIYSLMVAAAVNHYTLNIRTIKDIVGTEEAEIGYIWVDL